MKHKTILAASALVVILALVALVPSGLSATTWLTYREDVAIDSGTVDMDFASVNQTIDSLHTASTNVTLPCKLSALNQTLTVFRVNTSGTNVTFNLTVNGVAVNSSSPVNWTTGNWSNVTLAMVVSAGVDGNDTYMNVSANANNTATVYGRIYADDAAITSAWLSSNVVVKEKDVTSPYVGTTSGRSFWVVNDSIAVSNSIGYTLSDVNLTPTFPSQTITAPATYYNVGSIADSASATTYAQYQKYGPYVHDVDDDSSGTTHDVTIYVQTNELLTTCVDWSVALNDDEYDDAFGNMNYNTLVVELNGHAVDWEQGSIEMEDLTIQSSYSNNKFAFTWTEAVAPIPPCEVTWFMTLLFGMALYLWIAIIILVAVVIVLVLVFSKKK